MQVENAHFQGIQLSYREIDALQREFQTILQDLAGNQSLLRFRHQYERLYRALRRSHDNERILFNKISELSRDMSDQTAKIKSAIRMAHEDTESIITLKQEMDKTYKLLEISKEREEKSKATIERIQGRIRYLQARLDEKKQYSQKQSTTLQDLNRQKTELMKLKEKRSQELSQLKTKLNETLEQERLLEAQKGELVVSKDNMNKDMNEVSDKLKKDQERKKKIEEEVESLIKQKNKVEQQLTTHNKSNESLEKRIAEKDEQLRVLKQQIQDYSLSNGRIRQQINNLRFDNDNLVHQKSSCNQKIRNLDNEIQNTKKRLNELLSRVGQVEKSNDKLQNQAVKLRGDVQNIDRENDVKLQSLKQIERQIIIARKINAEDEKQLKELNEQSRVLNSLLDKQVKECNKCTEEISLKESEIEDKNRQIENTERALEQLKKTKGKLEKDKEHYGKEATHANANFLQTVEEIKLKGNLISQFQKKNLETENKSKHQQQLYEAVRSDRNMYSKTLSETEDEIAEIKRRYKIVNHQISQLKEEITNKEIALNKERHEQKNKDEKIQDTSKRHEKLKKEFEQKLEKISNQGNVASKLQVIIRDSENSRQKLKEDYELIVAERDILGTQLIRRNDESALLYEKIKIQQSKLAQGEAAYRERLADIKLLEYKASDLKRELKIHMREANKIPVLADSIKKLQEELIDEKLCVRALSEQLQNPLNDHRLRKIDKDKDPNTHEMKAQIQTLQQRLIDKTEQVVQKKVIIHQKEKQIKELSEIMAKQPGPEAAKRISELQQALKAKTSQMKALAAELNFNQAEINEKKYDSERMSKEIQEVQRKYHEQRKREQLAKESDPDFMAK